MTSKTKANSTKPKNRVVLKNYSKIILFYPLFIYTLIALVVQYGGEKLGREPISQLAIIWIFIFFINLVIVGFDFSSIKFFVLFLVVILIGMGLVLLDHNGTIDLFAFIASIRTLFDFTLDSKFYAWVLGILGFTIIAAIIQAQVHFVKIEKNEIYIKGLAQGKSERFPTTNLQLNIEFTDIFELISMGAGTVTLKIGSEMIIVLQTVPFIRKKKKIIDLLLSTTLVKQE
ncbi:hypothetical protein NEF87_001102 [Candidatus Lokiarchaeum ossiferum]|uniref:DUF304 domain-containing protein n=1 Tax=Candidatus Lokiarchaeum ossiferum TaxID=2951803 RepID=A0ABY6HPJ5_9ARCH|nr:hypothetical protein NEF87_001102 [Candidatus Lokiarchaeum sp. B-35]